MHTTRFINQIGFSVCACLVISSIVSAESREAERVLQLPAQYAENPEYAYPQFEVVSDSSGTVVGHCLVGYDNIGAEIWSDCSSFNLDSTVVYLSDRDLYWGENQSYVDDVILLVWYDSQYMNIYFDLYNQDGNRVARQSLTDTPWLQSDPYFDSTPLNSYNVGFTNNYLSVSFNYTSDMASRDCGSRTSRSGTITVVNDDWAITGLSASNPCSAAGPSTPPPSGGTDSGSNDSGSSGNSGSTNTSGSSSGPTSSEPGAKSGCFLRALQ